MRTFPLLVILLAILSGCSSVRLNKASGEPASVRIKDTLLKIPANPKAGFNFGYLVYLPKGTPAGRSTFLMVETNNGGPNDTMAHHERTARHTAVRSGVANYVARYLHLPLLVPIFPRSATHWEYYTHALDRDALLSKDFGIERLDLQLLAMIKDARRQLAAQGCRLEQKFFMTGFSASGTFANRFSLLHPEALQAVAAGGINGIAMLPLPQLDGQALRYPLGTADMKAITGKKPDLKQFRSLPQLLYMGALDSNDAVAFDDAYSDSDRAIVHRLLGKDLIPTRWAAVQKVYKQQGIEAEFRTYPIWATAPTRRSMTIW